MSQERGPTIPDHTGKRPFRPGRKERTLVEGTGWFSGGDKRAFVDVSLRR